MTPRHIRWLALATAVVVLLAGYASLTKTVTIVADGRVTTILTRALTVGAAVAEAGIHLAAEDSTNPHRLLPINDQLVIGVRRAARIQLTADGQTYAMRGSERSLDRLLAEWGLSPGPQDRILLVGQVLDPAAELPVAPFLSLELRRAVSFSLQEDGVPRTLSSSASTLGEALSEHGIPLQAADQLQPAAETPLVAGLQAVLTRAQPLQVMVGDEVLALHTTATTVGEALAQVGLALQGLDYSQPATDEPLPSDGQIRIIRVHEEVALTQQIVPFETEWVENPEAELDSTTIIQLGQNGVSAARERIRYEDGEEVSRSQEDLRTLTEPQNQITGYGSKIVIHTEVVDGVEIEYYRKVTVFTTWYSACNLGLGTDVCGYTTASGLPMRRGMIGTYRNWYNATKFATVYVPGYGPGTIADIGSYSDRSVPWIDLGFDEDEPHTWTARYVTLYFTTPVPSYVPPIWPP
ncbi:MAG: DUF348 domain-containing protein [Anaerolineales bacterium]|nr:DUF348 domain-containing protein [Anaerolineales bacterium]